jgi:pimeloyl-ACP methyl ester carboxylesterase
VTVAGGHLAVNVRPPGAPALVFLHYWGGSRRTFDQVIAALTSICTTVTYDQRGWGTASCLPGPYGLDQLADDVIEGSGHLSPLEAPNLIAAHIDRFVAQLAAECGGGHS